MPENVLPTDDFSRALRALTGDPGAVRAESTINRSDFLGNSETWIVVTFRTDGRDVGFLQRIGADGSTRLLLPAEVMAALARQRERASAGLRRRGARQAVETKRTKGIPVGNPDALRKARAASRKRRRA